MSAATKEKLKPGCHLQPVTFRRDEDGGWVELCPCCGAFAHFDVLPQAIRFCTWCRRFGHGAPEARP